MPRSVLRAVRAENEIAAYPLPERIAKARTMLVWRSGHQSVALDAMRRELERIQR
jgi:hypothetical protein